LLDFNFFFVYKIAFTAAAAAEADSYDASIKKINGGDRVEQPPWDYGHD
jgi:hypothetical protein